MLNIEQHTSAYKAWEELRKTHEEQNVARKLQLQRELAALNMADGESINSYFIRADRLRMQLSSAGASIKDDELILPLVRGLPNIYDTMVTTLENSDDLTIAQIRQRLMI